MKKRTNYSRRDSERMKDPNRTNRWALLGIAVLAIFTIGIVVLLSVRSSG